MTFAVGRKDASKNCLSAGAVYEYARESRKLRGLLALMNPKRPRERWEIMRPGSIDGRSRSRVRSRAIQQEATLVALLVRGFG